jgi:hypothetical protein
MGDPEECKVLMVVVALAFAEECRRPSSRASSSMSMSTSCEEVLCCSERALSALPKGSFRNCTSERALSASLLPVGPSGFCTAAAAAQWARFHCKRARRPALPCGGFLCPTTATDDRTITHTHTRHDNYTNTRQDTYTRHVIYICVCVCVQCSVGTEEPKDRKEARGDKNFRSYP